MPNAPATICTRCNGIAGQCGCRSPKRRDERLSACKRGYDRQWRTKRRNILNEQAPVRCNDCRRLLDGVKRKIHLHHIQKVADAPALRLDESNIMILCEPCHNTRTQRGE